MRRWMVAPLLLAVAVGVQAQTPSAQRKELAAKLMGLQKDGIEAVGRTIASQSTQRVLALAAQSVARVPADKREAVGQSVQADVKAFYDDIEPQLRERAGKLAASTLAPIYEQRFTDDELRTIIAWTENPVSKKFQQVDSEVARALAEKVVAETRSMMEARLKTLEGTVNRKLAAAGAAPAASAAGR